MTTPGPRDRSSIAAECDVVVIGAGPAGIAAAIHLHWLGRTVQVFDKAQFPRDKTCGDGLTTLALRELEQLQFRPTSIENWRNLTGATLVSPRGREIDVPLPQGSAYAAITPRREFDDALVGHARSIGVPVHEGWRFSDIRPSSDGVSVTVRPADTPSDDDANDVDGDEPTTVNARYVVAADGAWSPVRKAVGADIEGYRGEWHAARQYIGNVSGRAANEMMIWFEPELLPGYAWSFPLPGGRVNFGFGALRDGRTGRDMAQLWRRLLDAPHIVDALGPDFQPEGRYAAWPIPARIDGVALASDRVLFVGDAAAATDILTGEGIGQALLTGRLAALAINAGGTDRPDIATSAYERSVRRELVADHRMSATLGAVMSTPFGAEISMAIIAHSGKWGRTNFARWMFEDEPRAITLTPRRWHRQFLARPGVHVGR